MCFRIPSFHFRGFVSQNSAVACFKQYHCFYSDSVLSSLFDFHRDIAVGLQTVQTRLRLPVRVEHCACGVHIGNEPSLEFFDFASSQLQQSLATGYLALSTPISGFIHSRFLYFIPRGAMPWLTRLVACLSAQRLGFYSMWYMWWTVWYYDKILLFECSGFPYKYHSTSASNLFSYQCPTLHVTVTDTVVKQHTKELTP